MINYCCRQLLAIRICSYKTLTPLFFMLALTGCSGISYLSHVSSGHISLLAAREDIPKILNNTKTDAELRRRLTRSQEILQFAHRELQLPDNGSYRSYVRLDRPHVMWSVVAAQEFSVTPETWCFPVTGCVAYRGYFEKKLAQEFAASLSEERIETWINPVSAYSTLGWFRDPILSSMMAWSDEQLASLIFHELAHQVAYAENDTAFNEAFATAVARVGIRRWLKDDQTKRDRYENHWACQSELMDQLGAARAELAVVYNATTADIIKRELKQNLYNKLGESLSNWILAKPNCGAFSQYANSEYNNARLASIATYHQWVSAFENALTKAGGDLATLYREIRILENLSNEQRLDWLVSNQSLAPSH